MSYFSSYLTRSKITSEELSKPLKLSKPSLDSDEEDYNDKDCFRLHEADIDGIWLFTVYYSTRSGSYDFRQVDARDNWLEDINWLEVKKNQEKNSLKDTSISDELGGKMLSKEEKLALYQELLSYLQPSETVLRSIRRMGACSDAKKSASASQRWLRNKNPKTETQT
ncbi:unnamed protein product [Schistosoma margrebowiei]|nr:unnamed protein product [Schistosoma margrebowiei]